MTSRASLSDLTLLRLEGPDCASFLQGYVTSDVDTVERHWSISAFTNLKGRVVATTLLRQVNSELIELAVSTDIAEMLASFLAKYLMFAKCELSNPAQPLFFVSGADAKPELQGDVLPASLGQNRSAERCFVSTNTTASIDEVTDGTDAWHALLIDSQLGWVGAQASEQYLPQMLGLLEHEAVSFSKGCYLGQEIVARVEHRGAVKRHLLTVTYATASDTASPQIGCPLFADDSDSAREVGNLVLVRPATGQALAVAGIDATSFISKAPEASYSVSAPSQAGIGH
ncbi:MAG: hypothetical protein NXH85_05755 [Pseudomonadaceae bacterium]|nr:hypothetical protein [Pseudomonadaceae bacterium]